MKFIVERDALKDALHIVVTRTKGVTIPILQHVLVEAEGQSVRFTGHDLDTCSQVTIPAEVGQAGRIAIPADRLNRLVQGLADGSQVTFESDDSKAAKLRSGRSTYQFALLPAEDFPAILQPKDSMSLTLGWKQVARLLKTPSPFTDKARAYLSGIYLHLDGKRLAACATDGHMLLWIAIDVEPKPFKGAIIPEGSCGEIVRIAGQSEEVHIEISDTLIACEVGSRRFVSKLIDGTFPDYHRVIPQATAPHMTLDSKDVDAALARLVAAYDPDRTPVVRFRWGDGQMDYLTADLATNFGQGDEQIECDGPERQAGEVGCNIGYLRELVDAFDGERVRFFIDGPGDPIRVENPDDRDVVGVLMPCRA